MGSSIGRYLAKVISWDFEVSDDDPVVNLELLPVRPSEVDQQPQPQPGTGRLTRYALTTLELPPGYPPSRRWGSGPYRAARAGRA
jgi:hypothetical protein